MVPHEGTASFRGLIQEMMMDTHITHKIANMAKAIGRLIKSTRLPCDLISVEIRFFSRIGPMTMPSTQIGRASCRERGCQYVSIPVVAVSLKKKKIIQ